MHRRWGVLRKRHQYKYVCLIRNYRLGNMPFLAPYVDTRSVRPLELIRKLGIVIGGHRFDIFVVVLTLDAPGVLPAGKESTIRSEGIN